MVKDFTTDELHMKPSHLYLNACPHSKKIVVNVQLAKGWDYLNFVSVRFGHFPSVSLAIDCF